MPAVTTENVTHLVPAFTDAVEVQARGYYPTPRALAVYRRDLGLDSLDLLIIQVLIGHIDRRPDHRRVAKVSQVRLSDETGIADRPLRRHLAKLEKVTGLVTVSRMSNCVSEYDLAPLWARLTAIVRSRGVPKQKVEVQPRSEVEVAAVAPATSRPTDPPKREDFDSDEAFDVAFIAHFQSAA